MSGSEGLTSVQAAELLARAGPNRVPEPARTRLAARVLQQVRDPMIMLLIVAASVAGALGDRSSTGIIAAVVVVNTAAGVIQEMRAERAIGAVRHLLTPVVEVRRDGAYRTIPTDQVVPGDVVALRAGDVVAADGVLVDARTLELNEASLSGESLPVPRVVGERVSAGTVVTRGRGTVLVERTGADSALGAIAASLGSSAPRRTPLQQRLDRLSRSLVHLVLVLTGVVVVIGLAGGRSLPEMTVVGLSLAVAALPESLPAVVTVSMALGAARMSRRNAVVRRLPAVETLGSVSVVATDKTGTITEGVMNAEIVWTPAATYRASGPGYAPQGELIADEPASVTADRELHGLIRAAALCNDARLERTASGWTVSGDPLEGALLALVARAGADLDVLRSEHPRIEEQPFDDRTRRMTTLHRLGAGVLTVCKGAPEAVLGVAESADPETVLAAANRLAGEGLRVIALADDASGTLRLLGLVGIGDSPRSGVGEVIASLHDAGIKLVLVTGDHPGTAAAVARRVGIAGADAGIVLGDRLRDGVLDPGCAVVARVHPEQKVAVVRALQNAGHVVAMLGDGVNDAPALRCADIGVAAGGAGTEVAKEAADLVLLDDNLGTVVEAVREGRRILANIGLFLVYGVAGGLSEVGVMLGGPAIGLALPLLPEQILWINLVTHGLTGVAFGSEPADPRDMRRPPRPLGASVLDSAARRALVVATVALTAVALLVGMAGTGTEVRRTGLFLALGLGQLGVALALRVRVRRSGWRERALDLAILVAASMMVGATYWPPLSGLLGTTALSARELVVPVLGAAVPGLLVRFSSARDARPRVG